VAQCSVLVYDPDVKICTSLKGAGARQKTNAVSVPKPATPEKLLLFFWRYRAHRWRFSPNSVEFSFPTTGSQRSRFAIRFSMTYQVEVEHVVNEESG
jgi:hypothetical protein